MTASNRTLIVSRHADKRVDVNFSDIESAYHTFESKYENSVLKMLVAM